MTYRIDIRGQRFTWATLKQLLAHAKPVRTGDQLAGLSANGPVERLAAQHCLADVPLKAFLDDVMQVDGDDVTALIMTQHDPAAFAPVSSLTVGAFRNSLLDPATTCTRLRAIAWCVTPEMVAAVSKIMRALGFSGVALNKSRATNALTLG
ncbi:ethanolamine ammonia-lyase subunit EutB [Sulfitobacter sp. AS59]|uniref:ethanolamine ammonia-lyase subunit EutB n=1 Tax=Sulfitobacter sp. AS59 TaxID=3135784 RepID=UPI00317D26B7